MAYAFRCNSCNSLEESAHAGERDIPLRCRVCGAGAHYEIVNGAPQMVQEPENWTVLADLDNNGIADILEYHGEIEVEAHVPFVTVALKDGDTLLKDENDAVVQITAPREGPATEPENPQFVEVEATEALPAPKDVVEA